MAKKKTTQKSKDTDIVYNDVGADFPDHIQDKDLKVKISAWIDSDVKKELKKQAEEKGTKYLTLMNQLLREKLFNDKSEIEHLKNTLDILLERVGRLEEREAS